MDKLQKDFFAEPSRESACRAEPGGVFFAWASTLRLDFVPVPAEASLTCAVTGPVTLPDVKRISGSEGRELLSEAKGLNLFK